MKQQPVAAVCVGRVADGAAATAEASEQAAAAAAEAAVKAMCARFTGATRSLVCFIKLPAAAAACCLMDPRAALYRNFPVAAAAPLQPPTSEIASSSERKEVAELQRLACRLNCCR